MTEQDKEELAIFRSFKADAPFEILDFHHGSKGEPDVIATLKSGKQIAFELTEAVDGEGHRKVAKSDELTEMLSAAKRGLKDSEALRGYSISVHFFSTTSYKDQRKHVQKAIDAINENGPKRQPLRANGKILGMVQCFDNQADREVELHVSKATHVGDFTLERTYDKCFHKTYVTPHPKQLVVYSRRTFPDSWRDDLKALFEEQITFERFFVFDYTENRIVFDSGIKDINHFN